MSDDQYYQEPNVYGDGGEGVCKVYASDDPFTAFVQILLVIIALFSLYVKRMNEVPRRKFMTWWLDISKQGLGAAYGHVMNMGTAAFISTNVRGDYELEDQCAWYAINFFIDTTLGLFLSVIMLQALIGEAKERNYVTLMNSGVYEGPDGMQHWRHQLLAWLAILTLVKIILIIVLWAFSPILAVLGDFLFQPMQENVGFELLFVMIILPGILNFFYFWVADGYLKAGAENLCAFEPGSEMCSIKPKKRKEQETQHEEPTAYVAFDSENEVQSSAVPVASPTMDKMDRSERNLV